jgi:ketosteroid isomerase-like protein
MSWLQEYFDAWNRSDGAGVASFMTDDVEFIDMGVRHTVRGNAHIPEFVKLSSEYMPGTTFDVGTHFTADDHYYCEWIWQPMGIPGVSVGTLRDGKIATNHDYWNRAALKRDKPAAESKS